VCVAIREAEPHRFERAALRWLARFCLERSDATLADVTAASEAFALMADRPAEALDTLRRILVPPAELERWVRDNARFLT
jgi:hypothetical protein